MKADRGFDGGDDGGGPEDLRTILRQWSVPAPSSELEEELRRTFRRGRSSRRRRVWLTVAASLLIVAALALLLHDSTRAPVRLAERPTPPLVSSPAPPSPAAPKRTAIQGSVQVPPAPAKRSPTVRPARNEVVVEPGQAELLAELARQWRNARQAGPGLSLPRIEVLPADAPPSAILQAQARDEVPEYRTRWKDVESEWPFAHWAL
jgi:hypothetical protein